MEFTGLSLSDLLWFFEVALYQEEVPPSLFLELLDLLLDLVSVLDFPWSLSW